MPVEELVAFESGEVCRDPLLVLGPVLGKRGVERAGDDPVGLQRLHRVQEGEREFGDVAEAVADGARVQTPLDAIESGTEQRGDQRMIMVVTGLKSTKERADEAVRFMDAAFKEFRRIDVFAKGAVVTEAEVWNGDAEKVGLTVAEPLRLFVTPEARQGLKISYRYTAPLKAPVAEGQAVGEMTIEMPGQAPRTAAYGTDATELQVLAPCVVLGPGTIAVAHSPGEHVPLAELARAVPLFRHLVMAG